MLSMRSVHKRLIAGFIVISLMAVISRLPLLNPSSAYAEVGTVTQKVPVSNNPKLLFDQKELCGDYYFGDGLGMNCTLSLTPDHRFIYRNRGCLGEYDRNKGSWKLNGDRLELRPEKRNKEYGYEVNVHFVPIKWGERLYLVDENEAPGFCAALKHDFPKVADIHGLDFIQCKKRKLPSTGGKVVMPARYRTFYEQGAIEATVVRVEKNQTILFDKGSADRITPGMLLAIDSFDTVEAQVLSCEEHRSIAKPIYVGGSDRQAKAGDQFTTGSYWHRPSGTGERRYPTLPKRPLMKVITVHRSKLKPAPSH